MQNIEKIYDQYFELVNRYLFSLTHNNDIAEEITQETFCRAVKKINTYNKKCKMSVWLCQIGKNIWYDQCRKNKRLKAIEDNKFINNNLAYTTEELVIEEEEKIMLYKKIQKLDEKTREVMYLRLTGELTFKEISNILDKTEIWVRVIFYRGKNKLKEEK